MAAQSVPRELEKRRHLFAERLSEPHRFRQHAPQHNPNLRRKRAPRLNSLQIAAGGTIAIQVQDSA